LPVHEFLHRFLRHVLPKGFVKVRCVSGGRNYRYYRVFPVPGLFGSPAHRARLAALSQQPRSSDSVRPRWSRRFRLPGPRSTIWLWTTPSVAPSVVVRCRCAPCLPSRPVAHLEPHHRLSQPPFPSPKHPADFLTVAAPCTLPPPKHLQHFSHMLLGQPSPPPPPELGAVVILSSTTSLPSPIRHPRHHQPCSPRLLSSSPKLPQTCFDPVWPGRLPA
jgi:hypothetical protein